MVSPQTPLPLIAQTDSSGTWVGWNRHVDSCHRTWHQKSVTQYYSIRLKRLKKGQLARLTQVPNLGSSRIQHEAESKSITLLVEQGADANVQVLQAGIDILKRNKIPSLCFARKQHWIKIKTANKIVQDWFATKVHTDLSAEVPDCCRPSDSDVCRIQTFKAKRYSCALPLWDPQMSCLFEQNQLTQAIQAERTKNNVLALIENRCGCEHASGCLKVQSPHKHFQHFMSHRIDSRGISVAPTRLITL